MWQKLILKTEECVGLNGGLDLLGQGTKVLHDSGHLRGTGPSPPGCKNIRQC